MLLSELLAISAYLLILLAIGIASARKIRSSNDFILGGRSMNFYVTALAAHASDMSSWLFLGYPSLIFSMGLSHAWVGAGLTFFMFLNWHFVAPKLRMMTEKYNSLTISSFFESRLNDSTGTIRIFTALITLLFYTIYICAGLVGWGAIIQSLFGISYAAAVSIGILVIIPYLFFGGFITLAWTDLFQGIFLIITILFVPLYLMNHGVGMSQISAALSTHTHLDNFLPSKGFASIASTLFLFCGWGLGYFGQPHIITKFMGIKNPNEIYKSKYVGTIWQIFALVGATLVAIVSIAYFQGRNVNPERLFTTIVFDLFSPAFATFILCAILGATVTVMDSQILILSSNLTEDFYKKLLRKNASQKELLLVSRISIILIALLAYVVALLNTSTINGLVSYAWFGLGASFGPLLIFVLYSKRVNRYGAWTGLLLGSTIAALWPLVNRSLPLEIPTLIPGFVASFLGIWAVSYFTTNKALKEA